MSLLNLKGMFEPKPNGPNVGLLRQALDHVTNNPHTWNQGYWASPNGCRCLAGHITEMSGHTIAFDYNGPMRGYPIPGGRMVGIMGNPGDHTVDGTPVPEVAARELGLPMPQAFRLFDGKNNLGELWMIANEITDGKVGWPDPDGGPREREVHAAKAKAEASA